MLATECEYGSLHAHPDFGIIEIIGEDGNPVPAGVEGRVVCTSLLNDVQPLIRYEIGDMAAWSTEPCSCGRSQFPVLREITGRLEDVITGLDGREIVRFHGVFVDMPEVLEGQIVQESLDHIVVNVVATEDFGERQESTIRNRITKERIGNVRVTIRRLSGIPRTERGKFRAVVSLIRNRRI